MPRIARVVFQDMPRHITQRGTGRMSVFDADADRAVYLDLLRERAGQYRLLIWAWCLMDNHIHLLAVAQRSDSSHRALGRTHADYAQYLNAKRRSCGHL
jgi:putative transposase